MSTVIGIRSVVSKKDQIHYVEIYMTCEDRFVKGLRCDSVFVREDMVTNFEALDPGATVQVVYNRFGRVESVNVL